MRRDRHGAHDFVVILRCFAVIKRLVRGDRVRGGHAVIVP